MDTVATRHLDPKHRTPVAMALERLGGHHRPCGDSRWSYRLPGRPEVDTTVVDERDSVLVERLFMDCDLTRSAQAAHQIWPLLAPAVASPAGARPVLPGGGTRIRIRAERPLLADYRKHPEGLAQWIETACVGVNRWTPREVCQEADPATCRTGRPCGTSAEEIATLCSLAGWSATERESSRAAVVTLPSRKGRVCQVVVTPEADAVRFRAALESAEVAESTPASQRAAAVALLRVAGGVRLVRAVASCNGGRIAAALEVRLPVPIDEELVRHALSALATAHRQIGAELSVLTGQEALARAYLALQGLG